MSSAADRPANPLRGLLFAQAQGTFNDNAWKLMVVFLAIRMLERACGAERHPRMDNVVTVIFSSGSTGDPKGVLLTHFNIDATVEAVAQVFHVHPRDRVLGIRPLEGYGTTEASPVIAVGTLDFRAPGFYQRGRKREDPDPVPARHRRRPLPGA